MVGPWGRKKSLAELRSHREGCLVTRELDLRGSSHQLGIKKGPDKNNGLVLVAAWDTLET